MRLCELHRDHAYALSQPSRGGRSFVQLRHGRSAVWGGLVMNRRWTVFAILCALGGAPLAQLVAQQSGAQALVAADLSYERQTTRDSLQSLESQVAQAQQVPDSVKRALERARTEVIAFERAADEGQSSVALDHHRKATRALALVSRFIVGRDDTETGTPEPSQHRLRSRLVRFAHRLSELAHAADDLDVEFDVSAASRSAALAKTLVEAGNAAQARAELINLRGHIEALSAAIEDARAAAEHDKAEGAQ
jgi:hypothetical protein